mmetsp:Transcript_79416/g.192244  ORF Transcript_79416/g.192244 Transcript_79416/m.192244 type:complete len:263 (-) Transcript_79416:347-1135(-)
MATPWCSRVCATPSCSSCPHGSPRVSWPWSKPTCSCCGERSTSSPAWRASCAHSPSPPCSARCRARARRTRLSSCCADGCCVPRVSCGCLSAYGRSRRGMKARRRVACSSTHPCDHASPLPPHPRPRRGPRPRSHPPPRSRPHPRLRSRPRPRRSLWRRPSCSLARSCRLSLRFPRPGCRRTRRCDICRARTIPPWGVRLHLAPRCSAAAAAACAPVWAPSPPMGHASSVGRPSWSRCLPRRSTSCSRPQPRSPASCAVRGK